MPDTRLHLLDEGIAARASDIDVVLLHGYGFPRWKGGPMYWADAQGVDRIAADIAKLDGGVVGVVGHADRRGGDAYNTALGLRRAKAVFEAIAERLEPGVRSRLRVDISESPTAPVGVRGR